MDLGLICGLSLYGAFAVLRLSTTRTLVGHDKFTRAAATSVIMLSVAFAK